MTCQEEDFDEDLDREGFRLTDFLSGFTDKSFFMASSRLKGLNDNGFSFAIPGIVSNPPALDKVRQSAPYCETTSSHQNGGGSGPLLVSLALNEVGCSWDFGYSCYRTAGQTRSFPLPFPFPHFNHLLSLLRGRDRFACGTNPSTRLTMSRDDVLKQGHCPQLLSNCYNLVSFFSTDSSRCDQSPDSSVKLVRITTQFDGWISSLFHFQSKRSWAYRIVKFKQTHHYSFWERQIGKLHVACFAATNKASLAARWTVSVCLPIPVAKLVVNSFHLRFLGFKLLCKRLNRLLKLEQFFIHVRLLCIALASGDYVALVDKIRNLFFEVAEIEKGRHYKMAIRWKSTVCG